MARLQTKLPTHTSFAIATSCASVLKSTTMPRAPLLSALLWHQHWSKYPHSCMTHATMSQIAEAKARNLPTTLAYEQMLRQSERGCRWNTERGCAVPSQDGRQLEKAERRALVVAPPVPAGPLRDDVRLLAEDLLVVEHGAVRQRRAGQEKPERRGRQRSCRQAD